MARRFAFTVGMAIFLALTLAMPALAGGWATITLDSWPSGITAGQPLEIGFTVLQHGKHPMEGLFPTVTIRNSATGKHQVIAAAPSGKAGHYTATLTFPSAGTWQWSVQAFSMDQPMPPLEVTGPVPVESSRNASQFSPALVAGFFGLAGALVALIYALRRRRGRWALALAGLGVFLSILAFQFAAGRAPTTSQTAAAQANSQEEVGSNLFVAKGCITCHYHRQVKNEGNIFIGMGPDLSVNKYSAEYLHTWLKDPSAVKPGTEMPNLGLKENEIEALIAFLTTEPAK